MTKSELIMSINPIKDNVFDLEISKSIIKDNYAVVSVFDDISEGVVSKKHLSKNEAEVFKRNQKRGYFKNFMIIESFAIIGIVKFNSGEAYVFNKELPYSEATDKIQITSASYESLMDCYVFCSTRISFKLLEKLKNEYYSRKGFFYPEYHAYENLILKPERNSRNKEFIIEIIFDSIYKHGFREVGKKRWSNGKTTIKQKEIQRFSTSFPSHLQHTELNDSIENKSLIGSIFGKYYTHINQLEENCFGVVCSGPKNERYLFSYFEVTTKNK